MRKKQNPKFHGLFMGVDRYAAKEVSELRFAERDALALHALFTDTFGAGGELLTGSAVTRSAVEERFADLATVDPDDFVVVAFSGHGSETHQLVTYDADLGRLDESCISLDLLTDWFKQIPARRLVCVLDCCFSGAAGAKALAVESRPRSLQSEEGLLKQMAGDGRLILTAATASQYAYENERIGHGLLTHYLLEALQGAEEARNGDKISVYRLLEHVARRVTDEASSFNASQHPTLRGALDGELMWPVFTPGENYFRAFPERGKAEVLPTVESLSGRGFPDEVIAAWRTDIEQLNQLQLDAINDYGLLDGEHIVVSAPTSSGKTMIGELAALSGVLQRRRALFLLPLKALVNDKHQEFERKYSELGIRTIRATGDFSDNIGALMRGQYDICLMTYEKAAALALAAPHILDGVGVIVVDEVQMIVDSSRGANLEFLLTLIRVRRDRGSAPQVIALSAVIGDTNGLERWFGARLLRRDTRPVPLDEGVLRQDGSFRFIASDGQEEETVAMITPIWTGKDSSQNWVIPLVKELVDDGEQVMVFREVKGATVGCARYLAQHLGLPPADEAIAALPTGDTTSSSAQLRQTLAGGVAFHNADLDRDERLVIEEHFRSGEHRLQVVVATTTLAMGINTPASSVVIVGLTHPGDDPYTVAEYKNMVGRAGRLGYQERGRSFIVTTDFRAEHEAWTSYVTQQPESLRSQFLETDPRMLVLRVLATSGQIKGAPKLTAEDLVGFLENSFGAFQRRLHTDSWGWNVAALQAQVAELEQLEFIVADAEGGYELTPLGRAAGESGVAIGSMVRLVRVLQALPTQALTPAALVAATQLTEELDAVYFPINKRSTNKEPFTWRNAIVQRGVGGLLLEALGRNITDRHQPTLRAKKAAACFMWLDGVPRQAIERSLMQFSGFGTAAGPTTSVVNRTIDILPTVVRVAELLHADADLSHVGDDLLLRLQHGIPADMVELARAVGGRLDRSEYLALRDAGLALPSAVVGADRERLRTIITDEDKLDDLVVTAADGLDEDEQQVA
jgi:replicative superfamily II helicase